MTSDDPRPAHSRPTTGDAAAETGDAADPWTPAANQPDGQQANQAGGQPTDAPVPAPTRPRRKGLLIAAIVLFAIGAVFTVLAAVTPFVIDRDAPTVLYVVAMICTPVGFLLGLLYAILGSLPPRA